MEQYHKIRDLWNSFDIRSTNGLDLHLDSFQILFAYHSGKIENESVTYHDTRELFQNGKVTGFTGDPRAIFEQRNQKLCYELLKQRIVDREPLSIDLIREVHRVLTGGTYDEQRYIENGERPGEFKKHDYVTGIHEVGTPAEQVESELLELIDEVNAYGEPDILKAAAYFHAVFEYIHPFADGNGRVGRTLLNYYLMIHHHPPLIIYEEDRKLYYECLQKYDEAEELKPLREFLLYELEKTWAKALAPEKALKKRLSDL